MSSSATSWKYITTKNGEKVKIDAEDFERVNAKSWRVIYTGKAQKPSVVTSVRTGESVRTMTLGQFLMNPKKGFLVYPRRWQQGLDYRKHNLLVCSMKERQRMLPKRKDNTTSQYKGVSFVKSKKVWRARLEKDGRSHFLGDYESEDQAALAYNKAAREIFGDIAYQNQVRKPSERRK